MGQVYRPPAVRSVRLCAEEECLEIAQPRSRYCAGHGQPCPARGARYDSTWERFFAAMMAVREVSAENDAAYQASVARVRAAAIDWVLSLPSFEGLRPARQTRR